MNGPQLPELDEIQVVYIDSSRSTSRGFLCEPLSDPRLGLWLLAVEVPDGLGFHEPFRYELCRTWINMAIVAEVRFLPQGAVRAELERLERLHEEVRARMGRP